MIGRLTQHRTGWIAAIVLAVVAFVAFNAALSGLSPLRVDLTQNRLFSLAPGTRNILADLEKPVRLELYVSRQLVEDLAVYGNYAGRVRDVLKSFASASDGMVEVAEFDPEPFSVVEDSAVEGGLQGVPLDESGEKVYFGILARSGDRSGVIPFFQPEREPFLEYDLAKLLNTIVNPKKPVVGVVTSMPLFGDYSPRTAQDGKWYLVDALEEGFEVRNLLDLRSELTDEIDVLLVAHPSFVAEEDLYWIDQYLMRGGRAVLLVDPNNEFAHLTRYSPNAFPPTSSLNRLLSGWGVSIPEEKVVGDADLAQMVNAGTEANMRPAPYLLWMALRAPQISPDDPITRNVTQLNLASAGAIEVAADPALKVEPLLFTTERSQLFETSLINQDRPNITDFIEKFEASGKRHILAARLSGNVTSAFPDGMPKPAAEAEKTAAETPATETPGAEASGAGESGDSGDAAGGGAAPAEGAAADPAAAVDKTPPRPHMSASEQPLNVILVADADFIHQRFWVRVQDFFGQKVAVPFAHNGDFVVNAIDNLSGSDDLVGLRSRGTAHRPFTRVRAMRAAADERFRQKEQELVAVLQETEQRLQAAIQRAGAGRTGEGEPVLTGEQQQEMEAEMEQLRVQLLDTRRQLRDVQHALRQDIEQLQSWLRFVNIGLIPLLVAALAAALGVARVRRRARAAAA